MNKICEGIFKYKSPNFKKLEAYGFKNNNNNCWFYQTKIFDNQFLLNVKITQSDVETEVVEIETDEPYTLFLAENVVGNFVGTVKSEYEKVLNDISNKCFFCDTFKSSQAKKIIQYIENTYDDYLEFLWEGFPNNAIVRRKDTKKWYALFCNISKRKLGFDSDEYVDILNIRIIPEKLEHLLDNKSIIQAYHMNKKSWMTIILDGTVDLKKIFGLISTSYTLATK